LEPFGIFDLNQLSFISDRGTNLIKALQDYETLFCFPHRINNVLKRAFFQLKANRTSTNTIAAVHTTTKSLSSGVDTDDSCSSNSSSDDEETFAPTKKFKKKNKKKIHY
jgi:hypothetical protein